MKTIFCAVLLIIVSSNSGYSDDKWQYIEEISDAKIESIVIGGNNYKWVKSRINDSTFADLFLFNNTEWTEITDEDTISGYDMQAIAIDKNDILYIGGERHIYTYNNGEVQSYQVPFHTDSEGLYCPISHNARKIYVDSNNTKWIAFVGDFHYSPMLMTFYDGIFQTVKGMYVYGITSDSQNNIWYTSARTLYKHVIQDNDIHEYRLQEDMRYIFSNIVIDNNDVIWTSIEYTESEYSVIGSFKDGIWTIYNAENSVLPRGYIHEIIADQNDDIWIATDEGLVRFDGENWEVFTTENSGLVNDHVRCLAVEENNTLWIGTEDGLCKYTGDIITSVDEEPKPKALPTITSYPNPFNPTTTIGFTLPESGHASLTVYNLAGQKVRTLMDEPMVSGKHTVVWDGRDDAGNAVAAGVYVTRLDAGGTVATGKMVLVK